MPTLPDLEDFARRAGDILRAGYGQHQQVNFKGAIDLVTDTDRRSEAFLVDEIRKRFPHDRIVAEESGMQPGRECCAWYVDPLDGTVNFAHGVPIFTVSIAYAEDGEIRLGVVYDPLRDECFTAERDRGAWLNGAAIHHSQATDLGQSLLATGFPYDIRTRSDTNLNHFSHFMLNAQAVRRLGVASLDLCYVACGRLDGYWEFDLQPWDIAAGCLIAMEAGAVVTGVAGDPWRLESPNSILATTPGIHAEMIRHLNRVEA